MSESIDTFQPASRQEWRKWLQKNHSKRDSVWLIYFKKNSGMPTVSYNDAVDEALCFGWIDSKARSLDEDRFMQFFCKRKANSVWSKVNKEKVKRLIDEELMSEAGYKAIETAKQYGSWTILDDAEALVVPEDLEKSLNRNRKAKKFFSGLSRTDKRNLLQWLVLAKREDTRRKRIVEIVESAAENKKPKPFS